MNVQTSTQNGVRNGHEYRPQDQWEMGIDDKHSNNGCLSVLMVIALLAVLAVVFFFVTDVHAMEVMGDISNPYHSMLNTTIDNNTIPAYGCRTYSLSHVGGIQAISGLVCDSGTSDKRERENDLHGVTSENVTSVVTQEPTVIRMVELPVQDTVVDDKTIVDLPEVIQDDNSGNPGNDKNVGRAGEHCGQGMCENADGTTGEKTGKWIGKLKMVRYHMEM